MAYEILGSDNDEIEDIKRLESWFFEIPPINRTADPRQVKKWHKVFWLVNYLRIFLVMEVSSKLHLEKVKIDLVLISNVPTGL